MNYEEKINNLLEKMLKEHLIKQLKEGEDNGYSVEQQLEIIKNIFRNGD